MFKGSKEFIYEAYLKKRVKDIRLRDFRTVHGQRILREIAVGRRTLTHIKSFLSGMLSNPWYPQESNDR